MNTTSPETRNTNDSFFGGRTATVLHENGSSSAIKVRQLRLGDYEKALSFLDDEIALTAFCCVPGPNTEHATRNTSDTPFDKTWAMTLTPESYEQLQTLSQEVNAKGFFSYAARVQQRKERENEKNIAAMASLPPETLKLAAELGRSTLKPSSPNPRPR